MPLAYDLAAGCLKVGSRLLNEVDAEVEISEVGDVTAAELCLTLHRAWLGDFGSRSFVVSHPLPRDLGIKNKEANGVDPYSSLEADGQLTCSDFYFLDQNGELVLEIGAACPRELDADTITAGLQPFLKFNEHSLLTLEKSRERQPDLVSIRLRPDLGQTISDLSNSTVALRPLLSDENHLRKTPEGLVTLASRSEGRGLLGERENEYFDAKGAPYYLGDAVGAHKYSIDLASMANNDIGGVIVLGLRNEKDGAGRDYVAAVEGIDASAVNLEQYRKVADREIFPPIEGLFFHCHRDRSGSPHRNIYSTATRELETILSATSACLRGQGDIDGFQPALAKSIRQWLLKCRIYPLHACRWSSYA